MDKGCARSFFAVQAKIRIFTSRRILTIYEIQYKFIEYQ